MSTPRPCRALARHGAPLLASLSLLAAPAFPQAGPASDPEAIFVPAVPTPSGLLHPIAVSDFQRVTTTGGDLKLKVHQDVWNAGSGPSGHWILNDGVHTISAGDPSVSVSGPDAAGFLTISTSRPPGSYTLVAAVPQMHDYPIPTHWKWEGGDASNSHGSVKHGESDGIFEIDYSPPTDPNEPGFGGEDPSLPGGLADTDPDNPYYYRTEDWNLFDDGSGLTAQAKVPGRERFIGENYATARVTNLAATRYSDLARRASGHPVRHLSDMADAQSGLPYYQVVHAHLIPYDDPNIPGYENSLATFILPPGWVRPQVQDCTASGEYPVLFLPYYDMNQSTFHKDNGLRVLNSIAEVLVANGDHKTIGIVWNGGGTAPAQSTQESVDFNLDLLFFTATTELNASRTDIVAIGGSRGGTGSIHAAANLVSNNYRIAYAYVATSQLAYGDVHRRLGTSTYPLLQDSLRKATGYKEAWRQGWRNPMPSLDILPFMDAAADMDRRITALNVLTGFPPGPGAGFPPTTDMFQYVDDNRAPISPPRLQALAANGTQVFMNLPSHDFVNTFSSHVEFVRAARLLGIPLQLEINYREGHGARVSSSLDEVELLQRLHMGGTYPSLDGNSLYSRSTGPGVMTPLVTSTWPVLIELPQEALVGDDLTMTVAGQKGTQWWLDVRVAASDPNPILAGLKAVTVATSGPTSNFAVLDSGTLGSNPSGVTPDNDLALDNLVAEIRPLLLPFDPAFDKNHTFFEYRLRFQLPNTTTQVELSEHVGSDTFTAHSGVPGLLPNYTKQLIWSQPIKESTSAAVLNGRCGGVCEY